MTLEQEKQWREEFILWWVNFTGDSRVNMEAAKQGKEE